MFSLALILSVFLGDYFSDFCQPRCKRCGVSHPAPTEIPIITLFVQRRGDCPESALTPGGIWSFQSCKGVVSVRCVTGECWASGAAPLELGHIQGAVSAMSMTGCSIFRLIPHMKACSFSTQSRGAATESVFDAGFQDVQLSHSVAHTHFTFHHLDFVLITGLQTHMEFTQDDNTKIQLKTMHSKNK